LLRRRFFQQLYDEKGTKRNFFELKHFQFYDKNKGAKALDHFCPFAS
jgi:hypothetical protein